MEIIKSIIRNIIVIIILASFLEMLLPSSPMKRYVKLVMGLFIMVTILGPILSLVDKNYSFELGSYQINSDEQINDILKKAKNISETNKQKAKEEYQLVLSKQIQGIAQLNEGLKIVDAQIKLKEENQSSGIVGIDEVTLVVDKENNTAQRKSSKEKSIKKNTENTLENNFQVLNKEETIKTVQPVKIQIGQIDNSFMEGGQPIERLTQKEKDKIITTIANIYNLTENQIKIIEKN